MAKENKLEENLQTVLFRMVRNDTWSLEKDEDRTKEFASWINILSTRIQLGQSTADVSSELVANSYANFCGYNPGSRSVLLGYLPDPVCARLAMCLMDDTFAHNVTIRSDLLTIKGENKTWWTGTMKKIFSSGIVTPDKGDFGEVVVALYTLFCGDVLRMQINEQNMEKQTFLEGNEVNMIQNYTQFSVPLDDWLHQMMSGGIFSDEPETTVTTNCKVTVGFIQICRNSLRSYTKSWKILGGQTFLKQIYESGVAFYACNDCPSFDMVVPLRIERDGNNGKVDDSHSTKLEYAPMLISIKCHSSFPQSQPEKECKELKNKAKKSGLKKAFCLLIVFGSKQDTPFQEDIGSIDANVSDLLLEDNVIVKAIRIPLKDTFGLSGLFNDLTPSATIDSELLAAHTFLMAHGDEEKDTSLSAEKALYSHASAKWKKDFTSVRSAMVPSLRSIPNIS